MRQLEQMLEFAPQVQKNINRTIDVYTSGTAALYTGPVIIPSQANYGQFVVPYGNVTEMGGDVHDTFKTDRYDNPYGGHTTINIPGYNKIHLPWDE
jgi:hypothetical protein